MFKKQTRYCQLCQKKCSLKNLECQQGEALFDEIYGIEQKSLISLLSNMLGLHDETETTPATLSQLIMDSAQHLKKQQALPTQIIHFLYFHDSPISIETLGYTFHISESELIPILNELAKLNYIQFNVHSVLLSQFGKEYAQNNENKLFENHLSYQEVEQLKTLLHKLTSSWSLE